MRVELIDFATIWLPMTVGDLRMAGKIAGKFGRISE
jgi:hypothetical protein